MQVAPHASPRASGCPFSRLFGSSSQSASDGAQGHAAQGPPPASQDRFTPSVPIIDGEPQVPSAWQVAKRLFVPAKPEPLPALSRADVGLSAEGPNGPWVQPGNLWPGEPVHPLFPEFRNLPGREKAESVAHYAEQSRRSGRLEPLAQHGITVHPQLIVDPNGMRWPFEPEAQTVAAYPREKNMHGRGTWGQVEVVPSEDPSKRRWAGILASGGLGDMRLSLGAGQDTNVVGAALGIPLGPNSGGVESANLLMLSGPGPQLDDLDFFARPLSTVAIPDPTTPTLFKALDQMFKASAESGVRPGNHMFAYTQDGPDVASPRIPDEVRLVPNPALTLHRLAPLASQAVDGVEGEAVREKFAQWDVSVAGQPQAVRDLALSEALLEPNPALQIGSVVSFQEAVPTGGGLEGGVGDGDPKGTAAFTGRVVESTPDGARVVFEPLDRESQMAVYRSMDLVWELSRRMSGVEDLFTVEVREGEQWHREVAQIKARGDFFPNAFADHQRLYGHSERPSRTPRLRKILEGIRYVTGSIAEGLGMAFRPGGPETAVGTCPFR